MIIEYGNTKVSEQWFVTEETATGYSRIYYVFDGDVTYSDSNQTCKLEKDFLYILPTTSPYKMKQNKNNRLECTFIHIDFSPLFLKKIIGIKVEKDTLMYFILNSIRKAIEKKKKRLIISTCLALEVFLTEEKIFSLPPSPIYAGVEYMNENFNSSLKINEISQKLGYNPKYFIRLFKKHMEISPYEYIMNLRFKETLLLFRSDYTLTEIAQMVGYSDLKTFSRAFKNKYGISPQKYRDNFIFME